MDLAGSYLLVALSPLMSKRLLHETSGQRPAAWTAFGRVEGEAPPVGFWYHVEAVFPPKGEPEAARPERTILIKWEWVEFARLILKKPGPGELEEIRKEIGFRLR